MLLRQDNADLRLTPKAAEIGLATGERVRRIEEKIARLQRAGEFIRKTSHEGVKLDLWLRRMENTWPKLPAGILDQFDAKLWPLIETEFKYEGHLERQQVQINRMARQEQKAIPAWVDYSTLHGMKTEAKIKLQQIRPLTLGQAARVSGITPADIALLSIWLEKREREQNVDA